MTNVPIVEMLLHPPLGFLKRELITGTFTGSGDLDRPSSFLAPFNNVNAYGLTWSFFTVPAGFGFTLGQPIVYDERMLQLSTVHRDYAGNDMTSEFHEFYSEGLWWMWDNPGPQRIHYEIAPGVVIVFYWLVVNVP